MTPHYADDLVTLHHGDCLDVLRALPDASVDAVVTDPPYGLEFMGREWDGADGFRRSLNPNDVGRDNAFGRASRTSPEYRTDSKAQAGMARTGYTDGATRLERPSHLGGLNPKCRTCDKWQRGGNPCSCESPDFPNERLPRLHDFQVWCEAWAAECLRVLKPGGHLLAFGGSRTWHRLAAAIEDAGFELRDSIAWLYGSGFPKSLDVSKALDKREGHWRGQAGPIVSSNGSMENPNRERTDKGDPVTPAAAAAAGWGTALKPAFEPIVVGRKPLIGTVADNWIAHGTGALNIDACRVAFTSATDEAESKDKNRHADFGTAPGGNEVYGDFSMVERKNYDPTGRWPTNVLLGHSSECVQVGTRTETVGGGEKASGGFVEGYERGDGFVGRAVESPVYRCAADCQVAELDRQSGVSMSTGGAGVRSGQLGYHGGGNGNVGGSAGGFGDAGGASRFFPTFRYEAKAPTVERPRDGDVAHPTVKPLDLMRWLVRLVTPPGGLVLEPFAGSGTTAEACVIEGFRCIAIEREATYLPLIVARLSKPIQPDLFGGAA